MFASIIYVPGQSDLYHTLYTITVEMDDGLMDSIRVSKHAMFNREGIWTKFSMIKVNDRILVTGNAYATIVSITNAGYLPVTEVNLTEPIYLSSIYVWSATVKRPEVPISSYGIIAFQRQKDKTLKYLLIRRCESMGLVDLIRGKYCNRNIDDIVKVYLNEMTEEERQMVVTQTFEQLCSHIWLNRNSKSYRHEIARSKAKWEKLDLVKLLEGTTAKYTEPEFGFPKGRRNSNESIYECAVREFMEETCIKPGDFIVLSEFNPLEELYRASNGVLYKHLYYLAELKPGLVPKVDESNVRQCEEVSDIQLLSVAEALQKLRPYDIAKKMVLSEVDRLIRVRRPRSFFNLE